ncbi:MAG: hypothetical protein Q9187_002049 [Circinaria calcarea]
MTSATLYRGLKAVGPVSYRAIRFGKDNIRSFHASMSAETDTQAAKVANLTGVTTTSLQTTLIEKVGAQHVDVNDISGGCGQSFQAIIVSPQFEKKNSLARHRLVNSALKTEIAAIHAWTPKCFTPEEWQRKQAEEGVGMPQGV